MTNSDTPDLFAWALEYARRGWSLVALHHVEDVGAFVRVCSCGNRDARHRSQAGKHPRDRGWAAGNLDHPGRWQRGERHNIGIKTGKASGFWVLDFDPDGVGDDDGHALLQRLADEGYHPHVRTGGGGYHFRFTLPDFEVRNRQSAGGGGGRTHALPLGWDVRGEGGQVVAPPSVTSKGVYVALIEGDDVTEPTPYAAPGWLLDMIRPQAKSDPPDHMVSTADRFEGLPQPGGLGSGSEHGAGEGSSRPADQVQAYCTAALYGVVETLSGLQDGRRSEPAAWAARRMVELANAAGWSHGEVYGHFEAATLRAAQNVGIDGTGGYLPYEIPGQWSRAVEHVGDRKAEIPPRVDLLFPPPPFPEAGQGSAELNLVDPGTPSAGTSGVNGGRPDTSTVGPMPGPNGVPPVMDPWQRKVAERVLALDVRDAADRFREQRALGDRSAAVERLRAEIIDTDTLKALPRLQPIVPGLFYRNTLARIIGSSGHGKSFVVLDLAARIGAGMAWAGRPVTRGRVLWLVAEGAEGVGDRVEAWELHNGRPVEGLAYFPRAVNALGAEWDLWCEALAGVGYDMIFLDTQARVTPGADEIDRAEQSELVEACDRLRVATGACVVLVHHRGQKGTHARGHTEVYGALQTQVYVEKTGDRITVGAKAANGGKTKDDIEPDDVIFRLVDVPLPGRPDADGFVDPGRKKAVLEWLEGVSTTGEETAETKVTAAERRARYLWRIIVDEFNPGDGGTRAEIKAHFFDVPEVAGMKPATKRQVWQRSWNALIALGLLAKHVKSARFKIVEVVDQSAAGVLTANPGVESGAVGRLNYNWELWTDDLESKDLEGKA